MKSGVRSRVQVLAGCVLLCMGGMVQAQSLDGGNANGNSVFALPEGINQLIALDAQNLLLAAVEDENGTAGFSGLPVQHIYAGGIARLLGGTALLTGPLVSPAFNGRNKRWGNGN